MAEDTWDKPMPSPIRKMIFLGFDAASTWAVVVILTDEQAAQMHNKSKADRILVFIFIKSWIHFPNEAGIF